MESRAHKAGDVLNICPHFSLASYTPKSMHILVYTPDDVPQGISRVQPTLYPVSAVSYRKRFMDEAAARWGRAAEEMRDAIEKTADAAEAVDSYPLKSEDEPSGDQGDDAQ